LRNLALVYEVLTEVYRYKLAERLSERLNELGQDLSSMIEEVNAASANLSKTTKADEPVRTHHFSTIPRIDSLTMI
jgi:hypothetical protein